MAFPETRNYEFDENPAGTLPLGAGHEMKIDQLSDKGFEYQTDAGVTFVADLQGSVAGNVWTNIQAGLGAADAQGAIPAQYNRVRLNGTTAGLTQGAVLKISGKVL